jgi:hypothetical protein
MTTVFSTEWLTQVIMSFLHLYFLLVQLSLMQVTISDIQRGPITSSSPHFEVLLTLASLGFRNPLPDDPAGVIHRSGGLKLHGLHHIALTDTYLEWQGHHFHWWCIGVTNLHTWKTQKYVFRYLWLREMWITWHWICTPEQRTQDMIIIVLRYIVEALLWISLMHQLLSISPDFLQGLRSK